MPPIQRRLFTNDLTNALKPFSVLRFLGPEGTNSYGVLDSTGKPITLDWSQRRLPTDSSQSDSYNGKIGESWEYMIELCNLTHSDMWINIPGPATDDYVNNLARFIKNGDTVGGVVYPGLNPSLKLYLEYSNEVWGGIPSNRQYNMAAATAEVQAGGTTLNNDGSTDPTAWANRRYLKRTMEITQIFRSVFGADPGYAKLRPILGWQENNWSYYPQNLPWFAKTYGPIKNFIYGLGNANYWNATDYSSVDAVINSLAAAEPAAIATTVDFTTLAAYFGVKNVAYEGGPSINANGSTAAGQNALAASRDPRMENLVRQHYLDWYAAGGGIANYLGGPYGFWQPQNEWAAAEQWQAADPSLAAKYRGLVDVANAPAPAVTAGIAVSSTTTTNFPAAVDSLGQTTFSASTGDYWLLRVATAGSYGLSVSTGSSAAQIQVYVNDQPVGSPVILTAGGTIKLGSLPLIRGFNTLRLQAVSGVPSLQTFTLTPPTPAAAYPNFPTGFASTAGLVFNGFNKSPTTTAGAVNLTDGGPSEARSIWWNKKVSVQQFSTSFSFKIGPKNNAGYGFTFTLQNDPRGLQTLGQSNSALGISGITHAVSLSVNLYPNQSAVGEIVNGHILKQYKLTNGLNLHAGGTYNVTISYNGSALTVVLTDASNSSHFFFNTFANLNIPAALASPTAYIGFTSATGLSAKAIQALTRWTYAPQFIGIDPP